MTEHDLKQLQADVRAILLREQVHNALSIRRREFTIMQAEGHITELRQQMIAHPENKEETEKQLAFAQGQVKLLKERIEDTKLTQQELGQMMKSANIDGLIELLVIPE